MRIFPTLKGQRRCPVNLDALARHYWADSGKEAPALSPFLKPEECADLVNRYHWSRDASWSWGGYMENRSTLWRGSYLDKTGSYLHLGVDFNVPAGTLVAAHDDCTVVVVDNDHPELHGWGHRVIVRDHRNNNYLVYAHLGSVRCKVGQELKRGTRFAQVGTPKENGGWYPHLHLQEIRVSEWFAKEKDLASLDGYGRPQEEADLRNRYRDPVVMFGL